MYLCASYAKVESVKWFTKTFYAAHRKCDFLLPQCERVKIDTTVRTFFNECVLTLEKTV